VGERRSRGRDSGILRPFPQMSAIMFAVVGSCPRRLSVRRPSAPSAQLTRQLFNFDIEPLNSTVRRRAD
jgi:hypothetical protein